MCKSLLTQLRREIFKKKSVIRIDLDCISRNLRLTLLAGYEQK